MPYGFYEDRSKYEIPTGGGGLQPMFVHMTAGNRLDKTAREIYGHASQGGLVIWLDDEPAMSIFIEMSEYRDPDTESTVYRLCFGSSGNLVADTFDDYPHYSIS